MRVRLTVLGLMIGVAFIGLFCSLVILVRRGVVLWDRADRHSFFEYHHKLMVGKCLDRVGFWGRESERDRRSFALATGVVPAGTLGDAERFAAQERRAVAEHRRLVAYHGQMKAKYFRAADHPWLGVEPDPPMPEGPGCPPAILALLPYDHWIMKPGVREAIHVLALTPYLVAPLIAIRLVWSKWRSGRAKAEASRQVDPPPPD